MPTSKGEPERRRRGPPAPGTPWEKPEPIPLGRTWGGKAAGEAEELGDGREIKSGSKFANGKRPANGKPAFKSKDSSVVVGSEMHPSWIAKQRQKEMEALAALKGGSGKKITFD